METDPDYLFAFQLADRLHRTVGEIEQMPRSEFIAWNAYVLREAQLEQLEAQKRKG